MPSSVPQNCFRFVFGQRLHVLVKLSPQMRPATTHRNIFRQVVVSGIAIRIEGDIESIQKLLWMSSVSAVPALIIAFNYTQ